MTEKEAIIRVKFSDYKMVSNFLKNELGISQAYVNKMLKDMVAGINLDRMITDKIERFVHKRSDNWNFELYVKGKVEEEIDKAVKDVVGKTLRSETESLVREIVRKKLEELNLQSRI